MTIWPVVLVVGVATVIFKASGPVLLGRKPLPAPLAGAQMEATEIEDVGRASHVLRLAADP